MQEILVITSILLYGCSSILQKYAIKKMKAFSIFLLIKNPAWVLSVVLGLLGTGTYLLSLQLGSFSFVQTALSATTILPIVAGAALFKEKLTVIEWICVVLICAGIILYSASSSL